MVSLKEEKHINILWWTLQDSNLQPTGYEPGALTIELRVRDTYYNIQRKGYKVLFTTIL